MAISNAFKAQQFTRIIGSINPNMSHTAKQSLRYVEKLAVSKDKLTDLKGLLSKNEISKSELGKYAKALRKNLTASEVVVDNLVASTNAARESIKAKQLAACNKLDDSASILIASEYRKSTSADKPKALQDPRILGALAKAGQFISGVPDEVLATAMDTYFKSDTTPIGIEMATLEADENVLKAVARQVGETDNTLFSKELDTIIAKGDEIEQKAAALEDEPGL